MASIDVFGLVGPGWRRSGWPDYTAALDALVPVDNSPPVEPRDRGADLGAASLTSNLPIAEVEEAAAAWRQPSFFDDYYNRIHISPRRLDLGNVVSTQVAPVDVWNAYLQPVSLEAIDGLEDGLILTGQPAVPLLFAALQARRWLLSITPDGQPVLDTALTWGFDNDASASLRLTANRIIAWAFAPNWSDGITETLAWLTDLLGSESMVEQRRALRVTPRREWVAASYVEGRERQLLDLMLFGWGARAWAVPVWPDVQLISAPLALGALHIPCATEDLDFAVGGLAMLRGESAFDFEVVEIEDIATGGIDLVRPTQRAWLAGSRLYPVRSARLVEEPTRTRLTDALQSVEVRFRADEACEWPALMPATLYRGRPVLEQRPDEVEEITASYARLLAELDNDSALPLATDVAGRAMPIQRHRWLGMGRAERSAYRSLMYALRGRQVAVWVPTHADDLRLAAPVGSAAMTIDIAWVGYTRFGQQKPGRRDIRVELTDGTALHRRIQESTELGGDVERLTLDAALGLDVALADVGRICWMTLCRLDSDSVEIHHVTDSEGVAQSGVMFRGVRDDEF
jgi:hypothetical protein